MISYTVHTVGQYWNVQYTPVITIILKFGQRSGFAQYCSYTAHQNFLEISSGTINDLIISFTVVKVTILQHLTIFEVTHLPCKAKLQELLLIDTISFTHYRNLWRAKVGVWYLHKSWQLWIISTVKLLSIYPHYNYPWRLNEQRMI